MNAFTEIERKFLISEIPRDLKSLRIHELQQGYILLVNPQFELRLRYDGARYMQTFKTGEGQTRTEIEISITREQFEVLWPFTKGCQLSKTRWECPYESWIIELDIYKSPHQGLITAEVEFDSEEEARRFVPPGWFGEEITDNPRYRNRALAGCTHV